MDETISTEKQTESREKKLLDGFLGGKERIKSEITRTKITKRNIQGKLEF